MVNFSLVVANATTCTPHGEFRRDHETFVRAETRKGP